MTDKSLRDWVEDREDSALASDQLHVGNVVRINRPLSTMSRSYKHKDIEGKLAVITEVTRSQEVWYWMNVVKRWPHWKTEQRVHLPHYDVTLDARHTLAASARKEVCRGSTQIQERTQT